MCQWSWRLSPGRFPATQARADSAVAAHDGWVWGCAGAGGCAAAAELDRPDRPNPTPAAPAISNRATTNAASSASAILARRGTGSCRLGGVGSGSLGRSQTSQSSSPWVMAEEAAWSRCSSSSGDSRPSRAARRRRLAVCSRSSSDARSMARSCSGEEQRLASCEARIGYPIGRVKRLCPQLASRPTANCPGVRSTAPRTRARAGW
jgi:hypothetical protein